MTFKRYLLFSLLLFLLLFSACGETTSETTGATNAGETPDLPLDTAASIETVNAFCDTFYDKYATYFTAEEYQMMYDDYQGSFGGIGVSMLTVEENIQIYGVMEDTPASRAGLQSGESILSVDGKSIVGMDASLAATLIRGDIGTQVELEILRTDGSTYTVTLTREEIISSSVSGEIIPEISHTAYILIYSFTEQTANEFVELFNELAEEGDGIQNLILDLRSNGGGSFYAAINIANFFVPAGDVIVSEKTVDGIESYNSTSGQLKNLDLLILQNEWTASASEVLIGALKDEADATLIGSTTFGKGITQTVVSLSSGGGYRYTRSRYYTPSGYDLHGAGIEADILVDTPDNISSEEYFSTDPEETPHMEAAIEYLRETL